VGPVLTEPTEPTERRGSRGIVVVGALLLIAAVVGMAIGVRGTETPRRVGAAPPEGEVRILAGLPTTVDPAAQSDVGSAAIAAQLFESLTAFDAALTLRPALAESWAVEDDGRRVTFHLRPNLAFSDGSPLTADDVVRSWLRVIDPEAPSPLASLMLDVAGAADRLAGRVDEDAVGLRADGRDVVVDLVRPGADFPSIVAGPTFAVVPSGFVAGQAPLDVGGLVGSGGYVLESVSADGLTLRANEHYWAGAPAIRSVRLVGDLGGVSPVDAFAAGDLDYVPIGQFDATWIRYDAELGPALREVASLSLEYLGLDTTRPPFDDALVRQAVAMAVDWRRIVTLATPGDAVAATGMVPPGVPGRSETDFLPPYDPDTARALLAQAGYADGEGFPGVTFLTAGTAYAEGILADLDRELGIRPAYQTTAFDEFFDRLEDDPPHLWTLGWIADYPGRNDFLGVLLESGAGNNYGDWTSTEFDAAIDDALSTTDSAASAAAFDRAESLIQRDVPAVPLAYGTAWALARDGLLGAGQNGLGIVRMAGLAWADQ
jgi:ABC-type transport system substrate-binding protein